MLVLACFEPSRQSPSVDSTHLRHGLRGSLLSTNSLGHLFIRALAAMVRWWPIGSALGGRALWLWLGLPDSLQGVGLGMMLSQTLTRIHFAGVIMMAQLVGALVTMLAKATAPTRNSPGEVFSDFSEGPGGSSA